MVAAEARGFLLGPALALGSGAGFVLARKPGKLPYDTRQRRVPARVRHRPLEIHADALAPARASLVHDDLLATGGTAAGPLRARRAAGGQSSSGCGFLIELGFLAGRDALAPRDVHALLRYDASGHRRGHDAA